MRNAILTVAVLALALTGLACTASRPGRLGRDHRRLGPRRDRR